MSKKAKKIARWFVEGETGASSGYMAAVALGAKTRRVSYPYDPADFNRCLKLVKAVPEVRRDFPKIRRSCKQWRAIIDHWDELRTMFIKEAGWDWSKNVPARKTYKRMKALGV